MLNPDDQKRFSFITLGRTYYYVVMPFKLTTYQRLVDRMFQEQLGHNMEVCVDDMLVKSKQMEQHLANLAEIFDTLRKFRMKLNPAKCAFGVRSGKFLGYMVIEKGIEVNSEKIQAIQEMKPPSNLNEVQILVDCIVAASRFISQSAERNMPFFKALRKTKDFIWDEDYCEPASGQLRAYQRRRTPEAYLLCEQEGNIGNWMLHVDGSSTLAASGAGVVLTNRERDELEYALYFDFKASNNKAEYEALIADWRKLLLDYLKEDILPADEKEAARLKRIEIQDWYGEQGIQQHFISVAHPQTNGQVEVVNRILVQGIKSKLIQAGGKWVDSLPGVLWAYRTTPCSTTGETPFRIRAVIPTEAGSETFRIQHYE
ncbi:UNVERIFIED_CONTAM: Retrovirus-related Pol polyprotein from transposon.6 [Sesamum radiatum]|uniref:Retrovirus-related Pol polyprotein from transposon.6 n=1 Tax=Sesamum radiatum TaxID=300843 RepID=A0AAW2VZ34_SESRA